MESENIEAVSDKIKPHFKLEELYMTIDSCVQNLCIVKCGQLPENESDCKGYMDGHYSCDARLISDNANFHLKRGWIKLLERDLAKLLAVKKTLKK